MLLSYSIADLSFSMQKNNAYLKSRVTRLQNSAVPTFKLFCKVWDIAKQTQTKEVKKSKVLYLVDR